jgi:hypothetical protein
VRTSGLSLLHPKLTNRFCCYWNEVTIPIRTTFYKKNLAYKPLGPVAWKRHSVCWLSDRIKLLVTNYFCTFWCCHQHPKAQLPKLCFANHLGTSWDLGEGKTVTTESCTQLYHCCCHNHHHRHQNYATNDVCRPQNGNLFYYLEARLANHLHNPANLFYKLPRKRQSNVFLLNISAR